MSGTTAPGRPVVKVSAITKNGNAARTEKAAKGSLRDGTQNKAASAAASAAVLAAAAAAAETAERGEAGTFIARYRLQNWSKINHTILNFHIILSQRGSYIASPLLSLEAPTPEHKKIISRLPLDMQESTHKVRKSASQVILGINRMQLIRYATRRTPHGAFALGARDVRLGRIKPDVPCPGMVGIRGSTRLG